MPLFGVQSNQDVGLTEEEIDDILYLSRTGELDEIKTELSRLQTTYDITIATILDSIIDPLTGNGSFHLSGANGHTEVLRYLSSISATSDPQGDSANLISHISSRPNDSGNTPLHYAALNGQLDSVKFLVDSVPLRTRSEYVQFKNKAGHDAAFEAEGNGKEDVVGFLLGSMDDAGQEVEGADDGEVDVVAGNVEKMDVKDS